MGKPPQFAALKRQSSQPELGESVLGKYSTLQNRLINAESLMAAANVEALSFQSVRQTDP